jgi:PAS domain S-box-containing protein
VLATDTTGRITRMNRMAEVLTGWTRAEARGRPIAEVFHIINEESRAPALIPVDEVLATGEIRQLTNHTALIARDGTERAIADSAAPIRDPDGRMLGVVLVFRDMTGERAARKAQRESEDRYRTLFNSIDQGFCIIEVIFDGQAKPVDYLFLEINPSFERQTGMKDAVGKRMREFAPQHEEHWFETYGRVALTGEPIRFQNRAEQLHRSYDVYAFRFGDPANRQVAILFSDITERQRAQEELDRFFSLSLDFLCIAGMDGRFKRASPAVTDILGWSVEEFLARPYMDQIHPDDREASRREVERQAAGHKVMHFENRFQHKDGSWRVLSWRSMPKEGLMYATARDVTDYKRTQEELASVAHKVQAANLQLQAANTELEAFSYSVSHDLRAPLRHIQGYVEMLTHEAQAHLSDTARRYLKTITEAAREMGQLIDDLLAFSRMGRAEMQETTVDLAALIQEIRQQLERSTPGRNLRWNIAPLPKVQGDPAMLRQVLANLLDNAVKYTRPRNPAEIAIGCAGEEEGRVIFFVRDNGTGFDMQYAGKLFGVFQRLHRADEFEGTGIGLATVRRTIARHGGRTWAEARLDAGATFYFTLAPAPAGPSPTPDRS